MQRAALILLTGVALGAAGAIYYGAHRRAAPAAAEFRAAPAPDAQSSPAARPAARPDVLAALAARPLGTAERAALYAFASRADRHELEALLAAAAALPDQAPRAFALDVLLTRYAELDPGAAVTAAEPLQMPPTTVTALYHAWLEAAPTAALAALGELDDANAAMIGAGLIALVGDDELTVNRILAAVPRATADWLTADLLGRVAQSSPAEAFVRAREIVDPDVRADALRRVFYAWAERDPRAALDYLTRLDGAAQRDALRSGLWQQLASIEPELVLERTDDFPTEIRMNVEQIALQTLVQLDPQAAIARLAQMPPGTARQQLVQNIARSYAERDVDGALAWARSLQPPESGALAAVIAGIAAKDPMRALDLAAEMTTPMEQMQVLQSVVMTTTMQDPAMSERLLERVLAMPNSAQRQSLVQMLVTNWASREPADAADWLLSNAERAPPDVVTQVASQYARLDAAQAASYAARLPSGARGAWLRGVASAYAAADSRAALDWVEQLRGSPEYDDTAIAILPSAAQHDPAAAARLLDSIGRVDYQQRAVFMVAMGWANRDPATAANWAANLREPAVRMNAVAAVAQFWAAQDAPSAQAWALSQPAGTARDGALLALVTTAARFNTPDPSLLGALSTEQARLAAVQGAAFGIAQRNPDEARQFIETHVAEQVHRDRMFSVINQVSTIRPGGVGFMAPPTGGVFLPPGVAVPMMSPFGPSPTGMPGPGVPVLMGGPGGSFQYVTPTTRDSERQ